MNVLRPPWCCLSSLHLPPLLSLIPAYALAKASLNPREWKIIAKSLNALEASLQGGVTCSPSKMTRDEQGAADWGTFYVKGHFEQKTSPTLLLKDPIIDSLMMMITRLQSCANHHPPSVASLQVRGLRTRRAREAYLNCVKCVDLDWVITLVAKVWHLP